MGNPLDTWIYLNAHLKAADQAECQRLLKEELKKRRRKQFLLRIHSRLNLVRAQTERLDLLSKAK